MSELTIEQAKDIVELHKHLDGAIFDERLSSDMDRAVRSYLVAKGFVLG